MSREEQENKKKMSMRKANEGMCEEERIGDEEWV